MRRKRLLVWLAVVVVAGVGYLAFVGRTKVPPPSATPSFAGDSKDLKQTQIVATLDTPMEKGKNVIWCASFQAAWKAVAGQAREGAGGVGGRAGGSARR